MIRTVQAELSIAKGSIDEGAMVRLPAIRVGEGAEVGAAVTHASDGDFATLL